MGDTQTFVFFTDAITVNVFAPIICSLVLSQTTVKMLA